MNPRAVGDRIFSHALLGLLVSGFLALAATGELSPLVLGVCAAGFAVRFLIPLSPWPIPAVPAVAVNVFVLLYAGFYPIDAVYVSGDFLGATVRLICFLTVVKGLTVQTERDAVYAVLIGFTELLAAALLSTSLLFFVFLALFLFFAVTLFATWEIRRGARGARIASAAGFRRFPARIYLVSMVTCLGTLLFTVGLFFVLPRTARAALQNLVSSKFHLPGFGGEVDLRKIGEIQTSSRTVMYVRFPNQGDVLNLRWRGSAMSRFDGKRWTTSGELAEQVRLRYGLAALPTRTHGGRQGQRATYEVQLTETGMNALFIAGLPEYIQANLDSIAILSNGAIRTLSDMPPVMRYTVSSFFDRYSGDGSPPPTRERMRVLVELPANVDPRVLRMAHDVAGTENNPALQAGRLAEYLRANYAYTLELPAEDQADPIAHFLFERRRGHCEYFASSLALLLRAIGIPARVVTGFRGGTRNPVSEWYTVRASDAHSWVEAYIPGNGWTSYDATPASPIAEPIAALRRLTDLVEAADLYWQEWVVQYDLERQFQLASNLERTRFGTRARAVTSSMDRLRAAGERIGTWMVEHRIPLAVLILTALAAWLAGPGLVRSLRDKRRRKRLAAGGASANDATLLYEQFLEHLETRQIRKPGWFTPSEFAGKLPPSELQTDALQFTEAYNRLRFGGDREAAAEMLVIFDRIRGLPLRH